MFQRYPACLTDEKGLTLFEILLVITIVGLILSFGISAWLSMKNAQQISSTATLLRTASQCLENYVIHSAKIPPQSYFTAHCSRLDPWGNRLVYENNGDDQEIANVNSKTFRDESGNHPDAAWIIASFGPDRTRNLLSSPGSWDCSTGDDLCQVASKNALIYEITK